MYVLPILASQHGRVPAPSTPPRSVRLSLTDRCDLACVYCRPHRHDGYIEKRLDLDAWVAMVTGLVRAGVRRVRLTGGEPLLHKDIVEVVGALAQLPIDDLALTTNATRLAALAGPLKDAGLQRINVSVDTLDAQRFRRMTRGGRLGVVLDGIEAARRAGFTAMKLNAVVVRGENDGELEALTRWSWERDITPRFLEIMAIGEGAKMMDLVVPWTEMRGHLASLVEDGEPAREADRGPARYLRSKEDPSKRVGFISGTSDTYCKGCDRLRVASDGVLRPCLATEDGVPAGGAARAGSAKGVADAVARAWELKPDGDVFKGCTEDSAARVSIRAIGG